MIHEQGRILSLMKELLGPDYMQLEVVGYDLHEDFHREQTRIACKIRGDDGDLVIEGSGVGLIDAFFHGLLNRLSQDYPSLDSIAIDKFIVQGKIGTGSEPWQGDALAVVTLGIRNSGGKHFEFEHESRSVTHSAIEATLRAAEYFVNSEKAFITAYKALKSTHDAARGDIKHRYTEILAQLVRNTSYSEVIEQIKAELDV